MERNFSEQELVRREKANKLRELRLDPFGHRFDRTGYASEILEKYKDIPHDDFENINDEYVSNASQMAINLNLNIISDYQ